MNHDTDKKMMKNVPQPEQRLADLVQKVGETLSADRCFLYIRRPNRQDGRIAFCWRKDETIPDVLQPDWQDERPLPGEDPLYAAALAGRPSVYVDDVETAPPHVVNRDFEAKTFGHRALVHAHIFHEGELRGILQPCLFGQPRRWTDQEKSFIESLLPGAVPIIAAWLKQQTD